MILSSRKRSQLRKQQQAGQSLVRYIRQSMLDDGMGEADVQIQRFIAPGTKSPTSWWADVRLLFKPKKVIADGNES